MKFLISLITLIIFSLSALADETLPESVLKQKAEAFIQAKNARQQPNTTVEDIDHFISFLADEFIDEHLKFNVTITSKEELRQGMIAKMKDKVTFSEIKIDQMMIGSNVVFVKYTEHAKVKPSHMDKVIEYTSTNIMSLEFDDNGLIKHIRRHHA
ncbi:MULTISPECIES: nuclear transport factor 2 family protein [unclassified Pseudoalteromonas]|uniref:nuclear transport factor 2 family protein n=1 Tax=unclassified Pseudoalteromonas TaxID=194690 RepID=UPI001602D273|nr:MULTISPECIES: nuclear transport factor 2 family protein [unclassified Pseudoalteromonas]MBB1295558.1 nuclear transport factor 2 family protein [Pseudoalteromonas sp. SR41-4]MBB1409338.1 nuclear transport factor 2 family protein [Pseudoalteromonas sp. SG44-17]